MTNTSEWYPFDKEYNHNVTDHVCFIIFADPFVWQNLNFLTFLCGMVSLDLNLQLYFYIDGMWLGWHAIKWNFVQLISEFERTIYWLQLYT